MWFYILVINSLLASSNESDPCKWGVNYIYKMKKNNRSERGEESVSAGDVFAENILQILEEYEREKLREKQRELSKRDTAVTKLRKEGKRRKKGKKNWAE